LILNGRFSRLLRRFAPRNDRHCERSEAIQSFQAYKRTPFTPTPSHYNPGRAILDKQVETAKDDNLKKERVYIRDATLKNIGTIIASKTIN